MKRIVIIGNGIAGITAARYLRKKTDDPILVISAESPHFFSRTALMYIYMGHMTYENTKPYEDHFWAKNRIELKQAYVQRIDTEKKNLVLSGGDEVSFDVLIIASGSKSNQFGWPGQDLRGVQGLYNLQDLQNMEEYTKDIHRAVVIGGGLIGVEMAEMLHARKIEVSFLVRESKWMGHILPAEEAAMVERHIRKAGIDLQMSTELERIEGDDGHRVARAVTKAGDAIDCQFLGLTVGVSPNVGFVKGSGIETNRGILVDENLQTNIKDIYAIGDCAELKSPQPGRRPIEALWYMGRLMGQTVAQNILGDPKPYDAGLWFNSAKFFDIEYQVYGTVPPELEEGQRTLYWEHPDGEKSIRINYDAESKTVIGFNLMGVRYRHEACHDLIEQKRSLRFVLENLGVLNFDPEFYTQYERDVVALHNQQHPDDPVQLKSKRGLGRLISLLGRAPGSPSSSSSGVAS